MSHVKRLREAIEQGISWSQEDSDGATSSRYQPVEYQIRLRSVHNTIRVVSHLAAVTEGVSCDASYRLKTVEIETWYNTDLSIGCQ